MAQLKLPGHYFTLFFILNSFFIYFKSTQAIANECEPWVAKAISIQGDVERRSGNNSDDSKNTNILQWLSIKRDDVLCAGEIIRVKQNSRAAFILRNDTILRLNQNTTITLSNLSEDSSHWISLEKGIAHFIARIKQSFKIVTPFVNAAVEGTEFVVKVNNTESEITVFEGSIKVKNEYGEVILKKGQTAVTIKKSIPIAIIKIKPRDTVQWSLYYPTIIDFNSDEYKNLSPQTVSLLEQSNIAAHSGDINNALEKINSFTEKKLNVEILIYQATLFLAVGQIKKANSNIQLILRHQKSNAKAIALQAIIALVHNNKVLALSLAKKSIAIAPHNVSSVLALSYTHQSFFNFTKALNIIKTEIKYNENNALLWSRLSELYLMEGDLDQALLSAKKANTLNPNIARIYSTLGFAYLARIEVNKAEQAFYHALEKNDTDPLSRLGLGLAIIRQGDLARGRQQIEFAATLDPNNALIRSYLGKAYYEENRNELAEIQFNMAKRLDPNDPTAYYYDAIRHQSINQPALALKLLQQSFLLNKNKIVYRSKLLIDTDQATQNASIARIYQDLNFGIQAKNAAAASLNKTFSSYSAHNFLAQSYFNKPRFEIARASETLQAQLLSPINLNLKSVSLVGLNSGQIAINNAIYNQYDDLFTRNREQFTISTFTGSNNTGGYDANFSAIHDNNAVNIGISTFKTDGFRKNNDLKQSMFNVFVQSDFHPNHSVQIELNNNKKEHGDLKLKFNPETFSENSRLIDNNKTIRMGYRWKQTKTSTLIASFIYREQGFIQSNNAIFRATFGASGNPILSIDEKEAKNNIKIVEVADIFQFSSNNFIMGLSEYQQQSNGSQTIQLTHDGVDISNSPATTINSKTSHINNYFYGYSYFDRKSITLIYGITNDDINEIDLGTSQINPKLGYIWNVNNNTQFRLAAFRTLPRTLATNQTLEPTQIAGFNQFFDDLLATDAINYGIATDFKITKNITSGLEGIKRKLKIPLISNATKKIETQSEYFSQLYLHWSKHNYSSGIEINYEEYDKDISINTPSSEPYNLKTLKFPVFLTYSTNKANSLFKIAGNYYEQTVTNPTNNGGSEILKDNFWIWNVSWSYLLKKRLGKIGLKINNLTETKFNYYNSTFQSNKLISEQLSHQRFFLLYLNLTFN